MLMDGHISTVGYAVEPAPAPSKRTFPDGANYRIEIPSVEGPRVLEAVIEAAQREGIAVNRVSQGSGAMLLSHHELRDMAEMGAEARIEVSLFVGPREEFDIGNHSRATDGGALAGRQRSMRQLKYAVEDIARSAELGIQSFLIADLGLLDTVRSLQVAGELSESLVWKTSVLIAPSNPAAFRVLERLGASTVNVPSDVTLGQLYELRSVSELPIDLYVESPDAMAGVVRGHEIADLVLVGSPLYVKFGLRNSKPLYPSGKHVVGEALLIAQEKVHRAAVALEWLDRINPSFVQSAPGALGLGVPKPSRLGRDHKKGTAHE